MTKKAANFFFTARKEFAIFFIRVSGGRLRGASASGARNRTPMEPNEQSTGRQAMASAEGAAPAAVVGGNDWRSQLQYGARGRIINWMYVPFLFLPL
jgi:hypothetical protein